MKTITIDILNEKAINLLRDLESLKLIRLRNEAGFDFTTKYKGAMTRQNLDEVEKQLRDLRHEWE